MPNLELFKELLRGLPVSVNNLADPSLLRESTERKLDALAEDCHTGPVALITKGNLDTPWWRERLQGWAAKLNLFVMVSISGLPKEMEPAPVEPRYRTLRAAREAGAHVIGYVRPIIGHLNGDPAIIGPIIDRCAESGAQAIVSSGFRGDEWVLREAGLEGTQGPNGEAWSKRIKISPKGLGEFMAARAAERGLPFSTRTQCAVAWLSGSARSLNPYQHSPQFSGCATCPIRATCLDTPAQIRPGSVELLRYLGLQAEVAGSDSSAERRCSVKVRTDCPHCCTNCALAPARGFTFVRLRGPNGEAPTWGEMAMARFLTGVLATDPEMKIDEDGRIRLDARFQLGNGQLGEGSLYGLNSWLPWSEYLPKGKCYRCSYCFLGMYGDVLPKEMQVTVGMSPVRILEKEVAHE